MGQYPVSGNTAQFASLRRKIFRPLSVRCPSFAEKSRMPKRTRSRERGCAFFSVHSKLLLSLAMLLGRLEIYPILVLLMPRTWRR